MKETFDDPLTLFSATRKEPPMPPMVIPPSTYEPFPLGTAKAAVKSAGAERSDLYMVPIDKICVADDFNIRVTGTAYEKRVDALTDLIEQNGFLRDEPLTCFIGADNEFYVLDGHRRLEAARRVNERIEEGKATCPVITALPVVIKPNGTTIEDLTYGLVLKNSGEPLSPLEMGIAIARLQAYGQTPKQIAAKLDMTVKYVDDLLTLNSALPAIRTLVATGKVAAKTAIEAIREHKGTALAVLRGAVGVAEAAGKERATPKHVKEAAGEPKAARKPRAVGKIPELGAPYGAADAPVGMEVRPPDGTAARRTHIWNLSAGDIVPLDEIKPIARVYNSDWWELVPDQEGMVRVKTAIRVDVVGDQPASFAPTASRRRKTEAPVEPVLEEEEV